MARPPLPTITTPILSLVLATAALVCILHIKLIATHEEDIQLRSETQRFRFDVNTFRNTNRQRCALIRCGFPDDIRTQQDSTCDMVFVNILQAKNKTSPHLCALDYIYSQWDEVSRSYNGGIAYVANDVVLRYDSAKLPMHSNAVHFSFAKNHVDISTSWFSLLPSNQSRNLLHKWYESSLRYNNSQGADQMSLNQVRGCRGSDVVCHDRGSVVAYQCDNVTDLEGCIRESHHGDFMSALLTILTALAVFQNLYLTLQMIVPRSRKWLRPAVSHWVSMTWANSHNNSLVTACIAFGLVVVLGGTESWTAVVQCFAKIFGVTYEHRLDTGHMTDSTEIYKTVTDLRGRYEAYRYTYMDGRDLVEISGSGMSLVVWCTRMVLSGRRAMHGDELASCLFVLLITRMVSHGILWLAGLSPRAREEMSQAAERQMDMMMFRRSKEKTSRIFVRPKDTSSKNRSIVQSE